MNFRAKKISLLFFMGFFMILEFIPNVLANGDEFDDSNAGDFGWVAVGLFSLSILYVIFYHSFINSSKLARRNEKFEGLRDINRKIFLKVKKPLSYLHYIAGLIAIGIILTHGITLIMIGESDTLKIILGIITASVYVYYVLLGLVIKVVLKKAKKLSKLKMTLYKVHTNLIIIMLIGALHIAHLALGD